MVRIHRPCGGLRRMGHGTLTTKGEYIWAILRNYSYPRPTDHGQGRPLSTHPLSTSPPLILAILLTLTMARFHNPPADEAAGDERGEFSPFGSG